MVGPRVYHTKCNKSEKDKYSYHLHVESKEMIQQNLSTKQKQQTDLETNMIMKRREVARGKIKEFKISIYTLL